MTVKYVFLDEGGDLNFSSTGTSFYTFTSVQLERPFLLHSALDSYKYDLIEYISDPRIDLEYFHCAEDNSHVKRRVFDLVQSNLPAASVDAVIVEKRKTGPALQNSQEFYSRMLAYLLRYVVNNRSGDIDEIIVITDVIPINKKRRSVEKAIKKTLTNMLPEGVSYRIMHHQSRAHYGLQVADYLNWAIFRKWESGDSSYYETIRNLVRTEFDIFQSGVTYYY